MKKVNLIKKNNTNWKNTFVDTKEIKDLTSDKIIYPGKDDVYKIKREAKDIEICNCHYCEEAFQKVCMERKGIKDYYVFVCNECLSKGLIFLPTKGTCNGCGKEFYYDSTKEGIKKKNELYCDECGGM